MQPLFVADDLNGLLVEPTTQDRAAAVERVVWGWLRPKLGVTERPHPVPAEVFSWAVELGVIAHENPLGLSYRQSGDVREGFSAERRTEILTAAAAWSPSGSSSRAGGPVGSFPPAPGWPDPIVPGYSRTW